jgi:hypothetical protein
VSDYNEPRRRHPLRNSVIVLVVLAVLLGAAYYVANGLAKTFATQFVQSGVAQELGGSTDDVHVNLGKDQILLQLIKKHIKTMHVTVDKFSSGTLSGNAAFNATNVPLNTTDPAATLDITVSIGAAGLMSLVDAEAGTKSSVTFEGDNIRISTPEKISGKTVTVSADYLPSATGSSTLVLKPVAITVGSKHLTPAKYAKSSYYHYAPSLAKTRTRCLATGLPSMLKLTTISIINQKLVIGAAGTKIPLDALSKKGTCPA